MPSTKSVSSAYAPAMSAETRRWVEAGLALRPRGFLTDIDGTLSAVAPTPDKATLYRGIRPLLRQCLTEFDLVAAISGRPALDARRMLGVARMTYVGNHGMETLEPGARGPQVTPDVRAYQAAIADALHEARTRLDGYEDALLFENKGATASIHYRLAEDPERARAAIREALDPFAQLHHLRVTEGRMVVEIRPPIDRDKGTSVQALVREHRLACAVYLGDDRTDEDAFRALRELRASGECVGVAVAVGHAEAPASLRESADIALASIAEVPRFIRWMLRMAQS